MGAAAEFDDVEGPVRDLLVATLEAWVALIREIVEQAIDKGELPATVDAGGLAWQLYGVYMTHHTMQRLVRDPEADARAIRTFESVVRSARQA